MQEINLKDQKTLILNENDVEKINKKQEIYLNLFKFCFVNYFSMKIREQLGVTNIECVCNILSETENSIVIKITLTRPGIFIGVSSTTLNKFINYCKQFFQEKDNIINFNIEIFESTLFTVKKDLIQDYIKNRKIPNRQLLPNSKNYSDLIFNKNTIKDILS